MRAPVHLIDVILFTIVFAMATLAFGWWVVFVVGGVWATIVRASDRPVRFAAAGATIGLFGAWVFTGVDGPAGQLAGLFGVVLPLPMVVLYVLALIAAGALSAGGALLVSVIRAREEWMGADRRKPVAQESPEA